MIIDKFEEQVRKNPNHIAIKTLDNEISYEILNNYANVLAKEIICKNHTINLEKERKIVALLFEHGKDMIISTIGSLKANTIYVPLDPSYPMKRLIYMLENSKADFVITNNNNIELARRIINKANEKLNIINIDEVEMVKFTENINERSCGSDIVYILYTSGSTGKPKGIIQSHRNVVHFIECYKNTLAISNEDRMTLFSAFSHDAAIMDIYGALLNGATLYPLNIKSQISINEVSDWLQKEKITIWHSVPTVYRYFINSLTGKEKFNMLRLIVLGGENVILHDVEMFKKVFNSNTKLVNLYGQTESSYNSTQIYSVNSEVKKITLGQPVQEAEILVVDENREEVSPLEVGEIVILSDYVALGYWEDKEKTNEVFKYNSELGRTYWTGDLGKLLLDGSVEFLGRKGSQIKIRGFRIELQEIENSLLENERVKEAVVIGRKNSEGADYLCAYIVSDEILTSSYLRNYLLTRVPQYMIPTYFIQLNSMPILPNGKLDRKELPEPDKHMNTGIKYEAASNEIEKKLIEIWSEVLGVEKIGTNNDFFQLGGHSLKATVLIAKIHKAFNVKIPLSEIFKSSTIKKMAEFIGKYKKTEHVIIKEAKKKEYYSASSAQKRMYMLQQFEQESTAYNMPNAMIIEGNLEKEKLEKAFHSLIKRHESLRTSFDIYEDKVIQKITDNISFQVEYCEKIDVIIEEDLKGFVRPFDLSRAPLLRVKLIKVKEEEHILLFDMHHIISDGTSMSILINEFINLYQGQELKPLRIQYKDFSEWQNLTLQSENIKKQEEYWLKVFSDELPLLNIPLDIDRSSVGNFEGNSKGFIINKKYAKELNRIAKESGCTMYMVLLAALNILFYRYSGQEDIIIGSPIAGRNHADLENVIGVFINTLPMRNYPKGDKTFQEFLSEVKQNTLKAYENQDYQFEDLVKKLNIHKEINRNPMFDVMFTMQNMDSKTISINGLSFKPYEYENRISKVDLEFYAYEIENEIFINIEYCKNLFQDEAITRMIDHFINIIKAITNNVEFKISNIEMLTKQEKETLLYKFNNTTVEYPKGKTIHELFEKQVKRTPNNIAVIYGDSILTFKELNEKSNALARTLRLAGVKQDNIVGIMAERSLEMIVGIFGILKSGGAYLPINPNDPKDRINYIIENSSAKMLIAQQKFLLKNQFNIETVNLNDDKIYENSKKDLQHVNTSNNLAYVIYTSGSTGNPKGVMIEHSAIVNRLVWMQKEFPLTNEDVILQKTTYTFDVSVWELLWWSLVGAKVCLLQPNKEKDPMSILETIEKNKVTIMHFVPSMFNVFLEQLRQDKEMNCIKTLKRIFTSGEALGVKQAVDFNKKVYKTYNTELINLYGPTEAAVDVTYFNTSKNLFHKTVPIGKPIDNISLYVLGKDKVLNPIGVTGELFISGDGLARGYVNDLQLTEEKFIENPFIQYQKMYSTGDLARWNSNGNIEFIGRIDHQVKIRGFRIEMGEIENQLLKHPNINEALVVAKESFDGQMYLSGYIVAEKDFTIGELREYLLKSLPEYMIPTYFVELDRFPLTENGKVDRKQLPNPEENMIKGTEYVAPRNQLEEKLVEIWESVLGVKQVGVNDNFFELGGHSLKATILASKIYSELKVNVPLVELFNNPHISYISDYIAEADLEEFKKNEDLILFKKGINKDKNFFLIHSLSGEAEVYTSLVRNLNDSFNYWGIRYEKSDSYDSCVSTIEELASSYIKKMKNVQQMGPYYISGWCIGGIIAFEMARQLEAINEEVKFIGLYNSPSIKKSLVFNGIIKRKLKISLHNEFDILEKILPSYSFPKKYKDINSIESLWKCVVEELEKEKEYDEIKEEIYTKTCLMAPIMKKLIKDYKKLSIRDILHYFNLRRGFSNIVYGLYNPKGRINTEITYFVAEKESRDNKESWNNYTNKATNFYSVDADHFSMFEDEKDVKKLSKALNEALSNIS